MELQLKQCRNQHESEQEHSSNMSKFLAQHPSPPASALPLFVLQQPNNKLSTLSAFSDSMVPVSPIFPRVESCFSFAQWQELELQTLIFRYMLVGAPVPPELLQPIKKSFLHSSPLLLQHYDPPLIKSGYYWGRAARDLEAGRCRRTDGKKWRCSKDAVAGQKYCDRHMHRGRNRSRKHVEQRHDGSLTAIPSVSSSHSASVKSSFHLLHLSECSSGAKRDNKNMFKNHDRVDGDGGSDGHVLRHFFDDWPKTLKEPDNSSHNNNSGTCVICQHQ